MEIGFEHIKEHCKTIGDIQRIEKEVNEDEM